MNGFASGSGSLIKVAISFLQSANGDFVVLTQEDVPSGVAGDSFFRTTTLQHEDLFLERVIQSELPAEETACLASKVLLTASREEEEDRWVHLKLTREQLCALGLAPDRAADQSLLLSSAQETGLRVDPSRNFHEFLMQAPTPFAMLSGPEHRFAFINLPYVELIGRSASDPIVGRTVREVLPELAGQPFFALLDRVYRTGQAYTGIEVRAQLRSPGSSEPTDIFFDFIYHPVLNAKEQVTGILVQATDVTERVLVRAVSEGREQQIYRHWSDLELIFRTVPAGLTVIDAENDRVVRMNAVAADWFGTTVENCVGKPLAGAGVRLGEDLKGLLDRAAAGETLRNQVVMGRPGKALVGDRRWQANISPSKSLTGQVDRILIATVEAFV